MDTLENRIRGLLENEDAVLIDFIVANAHRQPHIKVFVDTVQGVTADQLADFSRKISDMIVEEGLVPGKYRLDVSSPGVDRPLLFPWQYTRNIGRQLAVTLEQNGETRTVRGTLSAVADNQITLEVNAIREEIPLHSVRKAIVLVRFS